jgi:hypothetical protein
VIGFFIKNRILEKDYKFFEHVAILLHYGKRPASDKFYAQISEFCRQKGCGTKKRPCDPDELTAFLKSRGWKFGDPYETQTPRRVLNTCKKLGVVLRTSRGRPSKKPQR